MSPVLIHDTSPYQHLCRPASLERYNRRLPRYRINLTWFGACALEPYCVIELGRRLSMASDVEGFRRTASGRSFLSSNKGLFIFYLQSNATGATLGAQVQIESKLISPSCMREEQGRGYSP